MRRIYSITNIIISALFLLLFIMVLMDIFYKISLFVFFLAFIFLVLAIVLPGQFITYDDKSYTYHIYCYKRTIFYKDISVISSHGLLESTFGCYYLWSKNKTFTVFFPFCNKKLKSLFKSIKEANPDCQVLL